MMVKQNLLRCLLKPLKDGLARNLDKAIITNSFAQNVI